MADAVFVLSHNNAREGAPMLCQKLAAGLRRSGAFKYAGIYAASAGANPENIRVVSVPEFAKHVAAAVQAGMKPVLILSTVVLCRMAVSVRAAIQAAGAAPDAYRLIGLVHEVRNETFAWVKPQHLVGLDALVFVAEYTMRSYGPEYAPTTHRRVIRNWLSPAEKNAIDSTPVRRAPVILMVGVVAPHKGQLHVAQAFARISDQFPDHELHLAGHVYDRSYADAIRSVSPKVRMSGPLAHSAVAAAMRVCDVFVHGSPMESCCLAVLEAMYSECAVLASEVGGIPEQIRSGENGLLYPHGDVAACADTLKGMLLDAGLRRELGVNARRTVQSDFYEKEKIAQYVDLFASL
nr:glycosyltransferase family 1 protein [Oceanusvirus sp.]